MLLNYNNILNNNNIDNIQNIIIVTNLLKMYTTLSQLNHKSLIEQYSYLTIWFASTKYNTDSA